MDIDMQDLASALEYNPSGYFPEDAIKEAEILALIAGEPDAQPWHWVVKKPSGKMFYLCGHQSFTGWDWGSTVDVCPLNSLEELKGHTNGQPEVLLDLYNQLTEGKSVSWRAKVAQELKIEGYLEELAPKRKQVKKAGKDLYAYKKKKVGDSDGKS